MIEIDSDAAMQAHLRKALRTAHMALAVASKHEYGHMVTDPIREAIHQLHMSIAALEGKV